MKFYIIDCFAEEKYQGNELLVVLADRPVSDREQQQISREINFSETVFILSDQKKNNGYDVRIWTPNLGEVPFAGHPVLGAAYLIWQLIEKNRSDMVILNLKAGQIPVKVTKHGMTMRQNKPVFGSIMEKEEIAAIYGIPSYEICDNLPPQWVSTGFPAVIIPIKTRLALQHLHMAADKFEAYITKRPACYCSHLFFTDMGNHILSARCFMENLMEDPATGSANGALAGYLLKYDYSGQRDISYTVRQGEDMERPSILHIHASFEQNEWLLEVGGSCHIIASGDWS